MNLVRVRPRLILPYATPMPSVLILVGFAQKVKWNCCNRSKPKQPDKGNKIGNFCCSRRGYLLRMHKFHCTKSGRQSMGTALVVETRFAHANMVFCISARGIFFGWPVDAFGRSSLKGADSTATVRRNRTAEIGIAHPRRNARPGYGLLSAFRRYGNEPQQRFGAC
jgi:hypothetical protein